MDGDRRKLTLSNSNGSVVTGIGRPNQASATKDAMVKGRFRVA